MTMTYNDLYPHQKVACGDIDNLFSAGHKNVLSVLPTGAGKTLVKAEYARRCQEQDMRTHLLAHRDVLLSQISDALCMMGVYHNFICSAKTQRDITNANLKQHGNAFYDERSKISVVSAVTLRARLKSKQEHVAEQYVGICSRVQFWLMDESHHLTVGSSWGICVEAYGDALGLGVTATPIRGDRKGLGDYADGYFTAMSVTTNMWELIKAGKLSPYKIFQPNEHIDLSGVTVTAGGDYNNKQLAQKVNKRKITGSAVSHYQRVLSGKRVITFGVDIEHCAAIAKQFNEAGVPSKAVSSKTPLAERNQALVDLESGLLLNLVNCDLFGEGFDCCAVEGAIMLRPTQSYSLYKQQFGRMLRKAEGKTHGILLDHVGNTLHMMTKFGLDYPHDDPEWTLDRGSKGKKSDDGEKLAETVTCTECGLFYIAKDNDCCPECGHIVTEEESKAKAREIQEVSGELVELSVDAITELMAERSKVDLSPEQFGQRVQNMPNVARYGAMNRHAKRQHAQTVLRDRIQRWCGHTARENGWDKEMVQREFNVQFGMNVMKAVVLSEREANELTERIPYVQ
jgi:superfamily II DNA or RNA helicase